MRVFEDINDAWVYYVRQLMIKGKDVGNTVELTNVSFTLSNIKNNILTIREDFSLHYYLGEMIWYGAGSNDTNFISNYGSIWKKLSDDGETNNSAYGHIVKEKHGYNQLDLAYEILKEDPHSRRAVININVPDGKALETKDEQCTIALQFYIRNNLLHATGIMRSNDIWTGTPYDIFYFTSLQQMLARRLGVATGDYTHFTTSLHAYHRNIDNLTDSVINYEDAYKYNVKIDGVKLLEEAPNLYFNIENAQKKNKYTPKQVKEYTISLCANAGIFEYL